MYDLASDPDEKYSNWCNNARTQFSIDMNKSVHPYDWHIDSNLLLVFSKTQPELECMGYKVVNGLIRLFFDTSESTNPTDYEYNFDSMTSSELQKIRDWNEYRLCPYKNAGDIDKSDYLVVTSNGDAQGLRSPPDRGSMTLSASVAKNVGDLAMEVSLNEPGGIKFAKYAVDNIKKQLKHMPNNVTIRVACLRGWSTICAGGATDLTWYLTHESTYDCRLNEIRHYVREHTLQDGIMAMEDATFGNAGQRRLFVEGLFHTWSVHDYVRDSDEDGLSILVNRVWPIIVNKIGWMVDITIDQEVGQDTWIDALTMAHDILCHIFTRIPTNDRSNRARLKKDYTNLWATLQEVDHSRQVTRRKTDQIFIYDDSRDYDPTSSDSSDDMHSYSFDSEDDSKCYM